MKQALISGVIGFFRRQLRPQSFPWYFPFIPAASPQTPPLAVSSEAERLSRKSPERSGTSESGTIDDRKNLPAQQEVGKDEAKTIADSPESLKASPGEAGKEGKEKTGDRKDNLQEEEAAGEEKGDFDCRPAGALQSGHVPLQRQAVLLGTQTRGPGIQQSRSRARAGRRAEFLLQSRIPGSLPQLPAPGRL